MSAPPYAPYPPYPPNPPSASPPPYPPFPPYPATQAIEVAGFSGPPAASPGLPTGSVQSAATQGQPAADQSTPSVFPGADATNPLSIFFNYGRYDIVDVTDEGLGQDQSAKLTKFVADAASVGASEIVVDGFASPEDNLPNSQLPLNRANAIKNRLDDLFTASPVTPTISTRTKSVLSGDQSTWPSLRRADTYITARAS